VDLECRIPAKRAFFRQRGRESRKLKTRWRSEMNFELPVPICERSDDRQVKLCDIETNCKALSCCKRISSAF
jgi:hypothetical protein